MHYSLRSKLSGNTVCQTKVKNYLIDNNILQEHSKALKVLKSVGNHEEPLKTLILEKNKAVRLPVESDVKRCWENQHKPLGKSYNPFKVFAHPLKALRKLLEN